MTLPAVIFAVVLAVGAALIISGTWMLSEPAGRIVAGVLVALWGWLVLSEVTE